MTDRSAIKVMLVDDHQVVRIGLRTFLTMLDDIDVVGEAADESGSLETLSQLADVDRLPDVVLMDLVLPGRDGIAVLQEIRKRHPGIQIVTVTNSEEAERVNAALIAGAAGYVLKGAPADEIAVAIRAAHAGRTHLDSTTARTVATLLRTQQTGGSSALTAREREVLGLVGRGASNRDIARRLAISERTAQTHISKVLAKLGLQSRTQAALWAVREGIVAGND